MGSDVQDVDRHEETPVKSNTQFQLPDLVILSGKRKANSVAFASRKTTSLSLLLLC